MNIGFKFRNLTVLLLAVMCTGCIKNLKKNIPLAALGAKDRSSDFADLFCTLIATEPRTSGGTWGKCSNWLDNASTKQVSVASTIDSRYRFLLIAGFGSDCLTGPNSTFMDSIAHLKSVHSYIAETLPVSAFGSSAYNSKQIAGYLNSQFVSDQRKYIVLGYSKGTADLEEALANQPGVLDKVAAFVTLSGIVQGSRLADFPIPNIAGLSKTAAELPDCTFGDGGAVQSSTPEERKAFLAKHPDPFVPTYSVAAYSTQKNTSDILLPSWDFISQFGQVEDSQMIAAEAIYPKCSYLGLLTRDHWAIAIPFGNVGAINKNDFPRPQLFEAILRFVIADLKAGP